MSNGSALGLHRHGDNEGRRSVVLIHGVNSSPDMWQEMKDSLAKLYDVWTFGYLGDQAIVDSAISLNAEMKRGDITLVNPAFVVHSMGGLVSRWFIEKLDGENFVSDLVMIATPNHGSHMANPLFGRILEALDHLYRNPYDGNGQAFIDMSVVEAGKDEDGTHFLNKLNDNWNYDLIDVNYHIVAGEKAILKKPPKYFREGVVILSWLFRSRHKSISRLLDKYAIDKNIWLQAYEHFPEIFNGVGDLAVTIERARLPDVPFGLLNKNHNEIANDLETIRTVKRILQTGSMDI